MPLKQIDPDFIPAWDKQLEDDQSRIDFWRTAAKSGFGDIFFKAIDFKGGNFDGTNGIDKDKWLHTMGAVESADTYTRRAKAVIDPGCAETVIATYNGYYIKIEIKKLKTGLSPDIEEKVKNDIDMAGTSLARFNSDIFSELITVGRTFVVVDAKNFFLDELNEIGEPVFDFSNPFAFILKRENVMDWEENENGFEWLKYRRFVERSNDLEKKLVEQIIIVDSRFWYVCEQVDGKNWNVVEEIPNKTGAVPIVKIDLGKKALPIINTISKWQLDIMNFQSLLRNTLAVQSLRNLQMPENMKKRFQKNTAHTVLVFDDDSVNMASWIGPDSGTMTNHFEYLEYAFKNMSNSGNLKRRDGKQVESAEAKEIDWFDSEAVINITNSAIEKGDIKIIKLFGKYSDAPKEISPEVEHDRQFIKDSLESVLNNTLQADLLKFGDTVMVKLHQSVRERLPISLDKKEIKLSDQEIIEAIKKANENKIIKKPEDPNFDAEE